MTKEELIDALAELVEGLEVPYSLQKRLLGAGGPAWLKIWAGLGMFGYAGKEDIKKEILKVLNSD